MSVWQEARSQRWTRVTWLGFNFADGRCSHIGSLARHQTDMEPDANGVVRSSNFPLLIWLRQKAGPELSDAGLDRLNRGVIVEPSLCRHVPTGWWKLCVCVARARSTVAYMAAGCCRPSSLRPEVRWRRCAGSRVVLQCFVADVSCLSTSPRPSLCLNPSLLFETWKGRSFSGSCF